jgi:hypothetical protein
MIGLAGTGDLAGGHLPGKKEGRWMLLQGTPTGNRQIPAK